MRIMQRWFLVLLMGLMVLLGTLGYLVNYRLKIEAQEERFYTFLIEARNDLGERTSAQVLFYHYPENFFLLYQINHKLAVPQPSKRLKEQTPYVEAYTLSSRGFKKALARVYGIEIDFTVTMSEADALTLLNNWGGAPFFNLHSTYLEKGLIFLDSFNYNRFMEEIVDSERVREVRLSIWYSILKRQLALAAEQNNYKNTLIASLSDLKSNLNKQTLTKLLTPLIEKEGAVYFYLLRSNLDLITLDNTPYYTPLEKGSYDRRKIADYLLAFKNRTISYEQFPITMQIKNTTGIKRFAARTAGVLRIRRIDVKEYLNSSTALDQSVLLDFTHSPIKTEYVKKITRVAYVYPLFDYRENFDFSLYIANDYYGIAYLKDK